MPDGFVSESSKIESRNFDGLGIVGRRSVDDGVVLICLECLLLAPFTPEGDPTERLDRRTHFLIQHGEHAMDDLVIEHADNASYVVGASPLLHK